MPRRILALLPLLLVASVAWSADRPYLVTNSGAAEEDEEQVWSVENWYRVASRQKSFTFAPEYAFNPDNSLQAEFRRVVDRDNGNGHELELEYKHLFNRISRDGWGWGVVLALDFQRPEGGPWSRTAASLSRRSSPTALSASDVAPSARSCSLARRHAWTSARCWSSRSWAWP